MNDLFNILIFSKDYNQGVIIQDYIKAIGYNLQDDPTIKIINVHGKGYKLSTRENDN